jgi:hypothetical protein
VTSHQLWGATTLDAEDDPESLLNRGAKHEMDHPGYYVSKLFLQLAKFLDLTFNGLNTLKDWQNFYAYLVRRLVDHFNTLQDSEEQKINADEIRMPAIYEDTKETADVNEEDTTKKTADVNEDTTETADVISLTRLLYQAMVPIRLGVADGQHRILATLLVLQGHHVFNSLSKSPPFYFEFLRHRGSGYGIQKCGNALQGKCSVRFLYHLSLTSSAVYERDFENLAEDYSRIRDTSQASKRRRTISDM